MSDKDSKYFDYYEILQVHHKAELDVIKKAYYTMMQKNHPDKGGSEELSKKINEAYRVLTDPVLRRDFDQERNLRMLDRVKTLTQERKAKKKDKKKTGNLISKNCPVMSSYGTLVTDERGNRVLIIDSNGEINWEYGKSASHSKLSSPKFANFSDGKNILVCDTGNSRIIEINQQKEIIWQFGTGEADYSEKTLNSPSSATKLNNGNYLITDTNNKRVIEINSFGKIVWQYGDLKDAKMFGKSFFSIVSGKSTNILFIPVFSERLENGNTLISDLGNSRIIEVNNEKKIVWQYPPKKSKDTGFIGANFCSRLPNGNTIFTFDKVYEISPEGDVETQFSKNVSDIDVNWAYKTEKNNLLVNMTRIVRRGINQEILKIDPSGKTIWRYYYSQYKYF